MGKIEPESKKNDNCYKSLATIIRDRDFSSELRFTASRSSGPGGQNVNKVNTRVEIRFSVRDSVLLSREEKETLFARPIDYKLCRIPANAASGMVVYTELGMGYPGAIASDIPAVDSLNADPLQVIQSGDWVEIVDTAAALNGQTLPLVQYYTDLGLLIEVNNEGPVGSSTDFVKSQLDARLAQGQPVDSVHCAQR